MNSLRLAGLRLDEVASATQAGKVGWPRKNWQKDLCRPDTKWIEKLFLLQCMGMATIQEYKNIKPELKAFIAQSIVEVLDDPDRGLELKAAFKKKLLTARRSKARAVSLSEMDSIRL